MIAIIGIAGAAGAITIRGEGAARAPDPSGTNVARRQEGHSTKATVARMPHSPRPLMPTPARSVPTDEPTVTEAMSAPAPPRVSTQKVASLLGQGRTTLTDGIWAVRTGDSVLVNFDTHGNRTRRADKFERMLRTTLPLVYGRRVTSSLESVPIGALLRSRDVVGELTSQGVHLTLDNGLKVSLWPQTRPTADGPLVVAYRVVVER